MRVQTRDQVALERSKLDQLDHIRPILAFLGCRQIQYQRYRTEEAKARKIWSEKAADNRYRIWMP